MDAIHSFKDIPLSRIQIHRFGATIFHCGKVMKNVSVSRFMQCEKCKKTIMKELRRFFECSQCGEIIPIYTFKRKGGTS